MPKPDKTKLSNPPHSTASPVQQQIDAIDKLLPQTQCTLCSYAGCRPYAEAITTQGAPLDRCLPGGVRVLRQLGQLLQQPVAQLEADLQTRCKPLQVAKIREADCIGCTKCIQACPVDAIIGRSKHMHRIITNDCTGCELCLEPCPVDCIDMIIQQGEDTRSEQQILTQANQARRNYYARGQRLNNSTRRKQLPPSQRRRQAYDLAPSSAETTTPAAPTLNPTAKPAQSSANYHTASAAPQAQQATTSILPSAAERRAEIARALAARRRTQTNASTSS